MPSSIPDSQALTPLDRQIIESLSIKLQDAGVDASVANAISACYEESRTPTADALLQVLKRATAKNEVSE